MLLDQSRQHVVMIQQVVVAVRLSSELYMCVFAAAVQVLSYR